MQIIKAFWNDTTATTSIEYAILGFFASISIIGGALAIGTKLRANFVPVVGNLS